jgi:hypothetical protein
MHLRTANPAACQADGCHALEFAPPTGTVASPDFRQRADATARRDRFDVADLAEYREVHRARL